MVFAVSEVLVVSSKYWNLEHFLKRVVFSISSRGFRGCRGFLEILEFIVCSKGLFSTSHLMVFVFLMVASLKKRTTSFPNNPLSSLRFTDVNTLD